MTSLFEKRSGTRDTVILGLTLFPDVDVNQLARELDLEAKASRLHGVPRSVIEDDLTEVEIIRWIEQRGRKSFAEYDSKMGCYQNQIEASSVGEGDHLEIQKITDSAVLKLKALSVELDASLHQEHQLYLQAQSRYESFRTKNGLSAREAYVPTTLKIWQLGLMAGIILIVESFINGLFFSDANSMGLVGGMGVAGLLSFFNLTVAMLQGRWALKVAHHSRWTIRAGGWALSISLIAAAVAVNLGIGIYREIYIANEGSVALSEIAAGFSKGTGALESSGSIALVLLGFIFHLGAVLSFGRMSDPYPGFTRCQSDWDEASQRYDNFKVEAIDRVTEILEEAHQEIGQYRNQINGRALRFRDAVEGRERLHRSFVAHLQHLRETAGLAIGRYRSWRSARAATSEPIELATSPVRLSLPEEPSPPVRPNGGENMHKNLSTLTSQCLDLIKSTTEYELNRLRTPKSKEAGSN